MQFGGTRKPSTGIVYDCDLGAGIDSLLALALLHGFDGKNEAKLAALCVNNPDLKAAQLADVIEAFYASANVGIPNGFFTGLPIGLAEAGGRPRETPIFQAILAKTDASGKPVYSPRIKKMNDTAIAEVVMRNALTAQYDGNAAVVLAGPATNLVKLLDLSGAKEWIASKAKFLVIADGPGFASAPAAAKRVLSDWPTPIIFAGSEIGAAIPFPAASIDKDFAYSPIHPIAAAYRAYKPMPYDAPTTDMAAILYAAHPKETYFKLSEPGEIAIGGDGKCSFKPSAAGKQRQLVLDPEQKDRILKIYTEYASAKPVVRSFRRPQVVAEDDAAGKKPVPPLP